jgi:hypothetical protein
VKRTCLTSSFPFWCSSHWEIIRPLLSYVFIHTLILIQNGSVSDESSQKKSFFFGLFLSFIHYSFMRLPVLFNEMRSVAKSLPSLPSTKNCIFFTRFYSSFIFVLLQSRLIIESKKKFGNMNFRVSSHVVCFLITSFLFLTREGAMKFVI